MRIQKILTLSALALAAASASLAAELSLTPVQDVLVCSSDISVDVRNLGVSNRGEAFVRRTLLQFDLREVGRSGRTIEKAALELIPSGLLGKEGGLVPITLWGLADELAWSEESLFWSNAPRRDDLLEEGHARAGLVRLASASFDADGNQIVRRDPVVWSGDDLVTFLNGARGRVVTLMLVSEGTLKTPGVIFFSKDNRVAAKAVYPRLELTLR